MPIADRYQVELSAKDNLSPKMAKASSKIKRSFKAIRGGLNKTQKAFTLFRVAAAGAMIASATAVVRSGLKSIDALGKMAAVLDTTTESLKTMQLAAELNGLSQDGMSNSLVKLNKFLGEAATTGGEYEKTLTDIGLSSKALAGLSLEDRFAAISKGINGLGDNSLKTAASMRIFGRASANMLLLMENAGTSIPRAAAELEKFGVVSLEDSKKVQDANDALSIMGEGFKALRDQITVAISPAIQGMAEDTKEWLQSITSSPEKMEKIKDVVLDIAKSTQIVVKITAEWAKIVGSIPGVVSKVADTYNQLQKATESDAKFRERSIEFAKKQLGDMGLSVKRIEAAFQKATVEAHNLDAQIAEVRGELDFPFTLEFAQLDQLVFLQNMVKAQKQLVAERAKMSVDTGAFFGPGFMDPAELIERIVSPFRDAFVVLKPVAVEGYAAVTAAIQENTEKQTQIIRNAQFEQQALLLPDLEMLRTAYATEAELNVERFANQLNLLEESNEAKLLADGEYEQRKADIQIRFEQDEQRRRDAQLRQRATSLQQFGNLTIGILTSLNNLSEKNARKQFENNKKLQIASTVINTSTAIMRALADGGPFLGTAMAIGMGIQGALQIANIKKQQFGGGGAVAAPSAPAAGGGGDAGGGGGGDRGPSQIANITLQGASEADRLRALASQINTLQQDGQLVQIGTITAE